MEEPVRQEQPIRRSGAQRRLYSEEEVRGILEQAMGLQDQEFTQDDLARMAEDLSITPAQLAVAEERWEAEQARGNIAAERRRFLTARRRKFWEEVGRWLVGVAFVFLSYRLRFLTPLATIGAFFLFFAALELAQSAYKTFFRTAGDRFERDFSKWLDKQERLRLRDEQRGRRFPGG